MSADEPSLTSTHDISPMASGVSVDGGNRPLFALLREHGFGAAPEDCKIHLATHNGHEDPLNVFLSGGFEDWQAMQTSRNFSRDFVVALIRGESSRHWVFAGCYRVCGVADDEQLNLKVYKMEPCPEVEHLTGRVIVDYRKVDRSSYRYGEKLGDQLIVRTVRAQRWSEPSPRSPFPDDEAWRTRRYEGPASRSSARRTTKPAPQVQVVPIETQNAEHFVISSPEEFRQATRHENTLVQDYHGFLDTQGLESVRLKILPPGETNPIYTDLFIESRNLLVEAKSSGDRSSIRMAIGQLYDYARFCDPRPDLAVLLPELPSKDLVALLKELRISIICRSASGEFNQLNAKAD